MRLPVTLPLGFVLVSALAASVAQAQVTISGTASQVTTDPGPQFDPSISGDIVVYTDRRDRDDDIYFTDLASGVEVAVATSSADQRLHDVSDGTIVFTDFGSSEPLVWSYDVGAGVSAPIAPSSVDRQLEPTVDGAVVAFEVYAPPFGNADIAVVDSSTGSYALLGQTPEHEGRPTVGGSLVVFERGTTPLALDSEIVLYDLVSDVETVLGSGVEAHTDGRRVAWRTGSTAEADIVVVDTLDGSSLTISYPGPQTRPRLMGDILAFDDESLGNPDVVLLHLPSGVAHRVVGQPGASEFLNDIDGNRLVYTSTETGNFDIFLYEFVIDGLTPSLPPDPPSDDPCSDTSGLSEIFAQDFVRERGKPELESASFSFDANGLDEGFLVVENDGCASALITVNGEDVLLPSDFNAEPQCRFRALALAADNTIDVELRSKPGCSVAVTVYAVDPVVTPAGEAATVPRDDLILPSCDSSGAESSAPFAAFALLLFLAGRRRRS